MRRIHPVVIFVAVIPLAWFTWLLIVTGHFTQWRSLPTPPAQIKEFLTSRGASICAKTVEGEIYHCTDLPGECWIHDTTTEYCYASLWPAQVDKPCNFSLAEFSFFTNVPNNIVDCIQTRSGDAGAISRYTYVLTRDGKVWGWDFVDSIANYCLAGLFVLGFSVGGVVIFVTVLRHSKGNVRKAVR